MSISARNTKVTQLETGIVILLFGNQVGANAVVERAPDVTGVAGTYVPIATVNAVEESGVPFFDYLPLTDTTYWYRAKAVDDGFEDSTYTPEVSAKATVIPRIDWGGKPWLYDSSIPLQLVMGVVSETTSSLTVSASINLDPVGLGTPVVSVTSFQGVSAPVPVGSSWVITKPASGSGRVVFSNALSGRAGDSDSVEVISMGGSLTTSSFYQLRMTVTDASADAMTVSGSVVDGYDSLFNINILSSTNVGTITNPTTNVWTIVRPTSGEGTVTFRVTGSAGIIEDTDTLYVSKDNLASLDVRASVTAVTSTGVTASIAVRDPYTNTGAVSGLTATVTSQSIAGFSATLASSTNTGGVYTGVYHIPRPSYGDGTGRITWVFNKSGYTPDSDSIEVPERVENLARLRTVASILSTSPTSQTVQVRVTDAIPSVGSYINLSYTTVGVGSVTPVGSIAVSSSEARTFTVNRPDFGFGAGRIVFNATASLRVSDADSVDVPEKSIDSVPAEYATITIGTVTSGSTQINIPYSFDPVSTAETVYVYAQESSGTAPTISSVEYAGYQVVGSPLKRNDGRSQLSIPVSIAGNHLLVTFIPLDNLSRRGTSVTVRYQSLTEPLSGPTAFTSVTNTTTGNTFVSNSIGIPASNLPTFIRTYRDGTIYGSDIARTAGASTSQTVIHTGLSPSTTYNWQYSGVNTNGAESTLSTTLTTTTTAGGTLPTPTVTWTNWQSDGSGGGELRFSVTNWGDYPAGTSFEGELLTAGEVFISTINPTSGPDVVTPYEGPGSFTGLAKFRAFRRSYTTSDYSTLVYWNNSAGGEDF